MKTILTVGVYDMLHIGHVLLFKHAKELFPEEDCRLIVAVQDGDYIQKYKPEANMVYSTEERMFMVSAVRWVDDVVVYRDVDKDIQNIDFDVFAKGPDQLHAGFQRTVKWCEANGKEVIIIPRTEGISSTMLREYSKSKWHDDERQPFVFGIIMEGSHPEEVKTGERRDFTAAMLLYAVDGVGQTTVKGLLNNGESWVIPLLRPPMFL